MHTKQSNTKSAFKNKTRAQFRVGLQSSNPTSPPEYQTCLTWIQNLLLPITEIGTTANLENKLANKIRMTNAYAFTLSLCSFVVSATLFSFNIYFMGSLAIFTGVGFLRCIATNFFHHHNASRAILIAILNTAIYLFATSLGRDCAVHFWFITSAMASFAIYNLNEIRPLLSSVALGIFLILFTWATKFQFNLLPLVRSDKITNEVISWVMITLSSLTSISIVCVAFYQQQRTLALLTLQSNHQAKNHLLALNASSIVAHTDRTGKITYVNSNFTKISGFSAQELLGQTHSKINSGHHSRKFFQEMWGSISTKEIWKGEICNKAKNGSFYWVDTTIVPILNTEGEIEEFVSIRHDITARKIAEAQIIQTSKLASLGEMSAGIAHEINNPLAIISGSLDLIANIAKDPIKLNLKIETMKKSVERISKIITGLRKFSRSGTGSLLEPHSLLPIAKESLLLTESKAKKYGISVTLDASTEGPIRCNEIEIEQVLVNLISNGIDAAAITSEKWVKISIKDDDQTVLLQVSDSGSGISENIRNKIFEPFYTTKRVGEGTGLGLSISKGILDEHGAPINVSSTSAHTCFEVRFPKHKIPRVA